MDQAAAKQQVIERLKQANNVLVTVANNPTVDQLAACIGMTLFLNKLEKHATAVYSGKTPPAIEFLQPEKTIEHNTDSLRDFIISLDKAKADKLRYKVEDKFVRIYITPYRTSISQKDLVFSEGDFNVDVVLALGVRDKAQLDAAITQHGRILHDASVVSVNPGAAKAPDIGQINWQEPTASSLSEMLVSISEAFGTGLIDSQMATSFLTGIVAETQRFSNAKTSPKVMTMAAQLMAAGANQQLIVSKLEPPPPPEAAKPVAAPPPPKSPSSDTLRVSHDSGQQDGPEVEVKPDEIRIDAEGNIVGKTQPAPPLPPPPQMPVPVPAATQEPPPSPPAAPPVPPAPPMAYESLQSEPPPAAAQPQTPPEVQQPEHESVGLPGPRARLDIASPVPAPHELLDPLDHRPSISPPFSADTQPQWYDPENSTPVDPLSDAARPNDAIIHQEYEKPEQEKAQPQVAEPALPPAPPAPAPSPEPIKNIQPPDQTTPTFPTPVADTAREAVNAALAAAPFNPAAEGPIKALNSQPLPESPPPDASSGTVLSQTPPEKPAENIVERPAPPPVPPPLKLDSGIVIPTTAGPANKT
ncbi:MAG TPA: hypothetical protein VFW52_00230 [Candidatus Saccharimonadales bacterium]|nr:hypothetical protein [Candidatus Saccharimonadales bacterium]